MPAFSSIGFLTLFLLSGDLVSPDGPDPDAAWLQLKGLAGTWRIEDPKSPQAERFEITFRLIARNTALVESFGDPAKQVTETIYHRDGDHLLATHYCAQGNQPRLRLKPSPQVHELLFEFHDATNLKNVADSHLVRMRFELVNNNRLIRREVYLENGKEHESTLSLVRSK